MKYLPLLLLVFLSYHSFGQSRFKAAELKMQETLGELIQKTNTKSGGNEELKEDVRKLFETTQELYNAINEDTTDITTSDTAYIVSLEQSQKALEEILKTDFTIEEIQKLINQIQKDYDAKVKASALAINSSVRRKVKVKVVTKKNNQIVHGYYVRGNQLWDYDLEKPKIIFNNPTNDAVKELPPGMYILWVEKDGKKVQSAEFEIGNSSSNEQTLIIVL